MYPNLDKREREREREEFKNRKGISASLQHRTELQVPVTVNREDILEAFCIKR